MKSSDDKSIDGFIQGVQIRLNFIAFARRAFWPLILFLLLAIVFGNLSNYFAQSVFRQQIAIWLRLIGFAGIIVTLVWAFSRPLYWNRNKTIAEIEIQNRLTAIAPLSSKDAKLAGGNKELWQMAKLQKAAAIQKLQAPKIFALNDFILGAIFVLCFGVFLLKPMENYKSIWPNYSILFDGAQIEINAIAIQPEYTSKPSLDISATNGNIELIEGSLIDLRINGPKSAPRISYGNFNIKMRKDGANTWRAKIISNKSAKLKLHRFGVQKSWRIKIIEDEKPKIESDFAIETQGHDSLNIKILAKDDYGIKRANLHLLGANKAIQTIIELDINAINLGTASSMNVKTGHSALVGQNISAYVEIEDELGQKAKSKIEKFQLPIPIFNSVFAKALQEIRLLILLETKDYKRRKPEYMWIDDNISGGKIKVIATDNIKNAPPNTIRAYELLSAIYSVRENLGLSLSQNMGITHAIKSLEYSNNQTDARKVAATLWSIIETFEHNNLDSRSKVASAIANLKNALNNGASTEEIDVLKSELKTAINEHLEALASQSGESGDMELAESEISENLDINRILDEVQNDANNGNSNDASAKLDELNQMLSQMQPGSGGQGQSISIDGLNPSGPNNPLAAQQQSIMEDTKNYDQNNSTQSDLENLIQKQENLLSQMGDNTNSETPNDQNLNDARAAMGAALEALKNNDIQTAQAAQQSAIDSLNKRAPMPNKSNNANDNLGNQDPLGRSIKLPNEGQAKNGNNAKTGNSNSQSPNGKTSASGNNDGRATKLPNGATPMKAQDILNRLRERLSRPEQSDEERNYLENAISNQ